MNSSKHRSDNEELRRAAANGLVETVEKLLELKAGAKADLANDRGWSPLFHGVSGNHVDISEILIAAGADLHRRSNTGDTVLHICAKRGLVEMLMRLVQAGADSKIRNNLGQLPEEIVPTTVEREIASWNNEIGNATFTDSIEYHAPRYVHTGRHWSVDSNGLQSNGSSIESQNSGRTSPSTSIISLNEKTRIPAYRFADDYKDNYSQSKMEEEKAKGAVVVANKKDLTQISQIYLKHQNKPSPRLERLLNQWRKHEDLKIRLRNLINEEIEGELLKIHVEHF
ncbi:unnamed protein product [Oikopleura dioica]|uniref:Uncharacterized protein n=1 Tax=Oikopleura dioica TaxID=34765 RepID=E4Y8L9_OIKDI|nr:unnamed protein product [Oikopleura dioica]